MKNVSSNIKTGTKLVALILCGVLFFIIMGAAIHHENAQPITGFDINTGSKGGNNFVDDSDIYNILKDSQYTSLVGAPIQDVGLQRLSDMLDNNPYIKHADVYVGADGKVVIKIQQRTALIRVINNSGVSFYLDENGNKMPSSDKFTPHVQVATGLIFSKGIPGDTSNDDLLGKLYFLAKKIQANAFMNALVQQVYVDENRELELVPIVGSFSILIGDTDKLDDKFANLQAVYQNHSDDFPWNAYTILNLKFAHQVVGIKNGATINMVAPASTVGDEPIEPRLKNNQSVKSKSDSMQVEKTDRKKTTAEGKGKKDKKKKHKKGSQ